MRRTTKLGFFTFATALALSLPALAQDRPTHRSFYEPNDRSLTLALDVGWNTDELGGEDLQVLAPTIGLNVALGRIDLSLDWPLLYFDLSGTGGDSTFLSGNPFAAVYLVNRRRDGFFRIGAGVAVPASNIDQSGGGLFGLGQGATVDSVAYAYARAIRGSWNAWLYYPNQFTFVVPVQLEGQARALVLTAEGAAALVAPVDNDFDDDVDVVFQAAGSIGLRASVLTAGLRLQGVWGPTGDSTAQLAAEPFVQADFGTGFAYARFLLNLDEPLGIFGSGSDLWGIFVGAGGHT